MADLRRSSSPLPASPQLSSLMDDGDVINNTSEADGVREQRASSSASSNNSVKSHRNLSVRHNTGSDVALSAELKSLVDEEGGIAKEQTSGHSKPGSEYDGQSDSSSRQSYGVSPSSRMSRTSTVPSEGWIPNRSHTQSMSKWRQEQELLRKSEKDIRRHF